MLLRSARAFAGRIAQGRSRSRLGVMSTSAAQESREKASVRCHPDEENVIITLKLAGKVKRLNRMKEEALEKSIGRIKVGLQPKPAKKKKKKNDKNETDRFPPPPEDIFVALYDSNSTDGEPMDLSISNETGWCAARVLVCGATLYDVILNEPTIEKILLPERPMVGFPLLPISKTMFAEEDACSWHWLKKRGGEDWTSLKCYNRKYTPQESDSGHQLRVECTPGAFLSTPADGGSDDSPNKRRRVGESLSADTASVGEGPPRSCGRERHPLTLKKSQFPELRVITYNILADQYASTEKAITELFRYCDTRFLDVEYRKQLILAEILGFHADVVCLQEVDKRVFEDYLKPQMAVEGFQGVYTNKAGSVKEGSAMFVRASRYEIAFKEDVVMKELFELPLQDSLKFFSPMLENSADLREALENIGTISQLVVLKPVDSTKGDRPLVVGNTHLFFHPDARHIRIMQTYATVDAFRNMLQSQKLKEVFGDVKPAFMFCGDFNSHILDGPHGVLQLLMEGGLGSTHPDWKQASIFKWGKEEGEVENGLISHIEQHGPDASESLCGFNLKLPFTMETALALDTPYTNYTELFKATLDYIWFRPDEFSVKRVIPMPTEEDLGGPVPSEIFPSDHLSVVVDLCWKSREPVHATASSIPSAVSLVKNSSVIAVPTDTLYGLAVDANDSTAIENVYSIKGRSFNVPLAICVADAGDVEKYCVVDHLPEGLVEELLPGPVTLVLERKSDAPLSDRLNPGISTVGVRVPAYDFIREVCRGFGGALALTSANRSGEPSSVRVSDFKEIWNRCSAVYDGGLISGLEGGSTVIDITHKPIVKVLREGSALDATLGVLGKYGWHR
ncbi:hypothetical protein BSKO_03720 [Bryopsis sp. KO-2023]|nr:hypothetical protein BSKO_03720 [Bryopsis sp. KO-2023]